MAPGPEDSSSKCCIQMNCGCTEGWRKCPCVPVIWPVGQSLSRELCHHSPKQLQESSVNDIITPVCLSAHMQVIGLHVFRRGHFQKETLCIFCFNAHPLNYLWAYWQVVNKLHTNDQILFWQRWGLIIKYKTCLIGTCAYAKRQRSVRACFHVWCTCAVSVVVTVLSSPERFCHELHFHMSFKLPAFTNILTQRQKQYNASRQQCSAQLVASV